MRPSQGGDGLGAIELLHPCCKLVCCKDFFVDFFPFGSGSRHYSKYEQVFGVQYLELFLGTMSKWTATWQFADFKLGS